MFDQFIQSLYQACRIKPTKPVLVGVSGGIDSICLLDMIRQSGTPVVVAHFNHQIRTDSGEDARFVEQISQSYGIPFTYGEGAVPDYAKNHHISIEEAARIARYKFLFDQAGKYDCQAVAVAHNADDQVETVMMHLLRGAGLYGLKGMSYYSLPNSWSDTIPLIRPLLGLWRDEITNYSQERGLSAIQDHTNLDTRIFRNRLRHELIPELDTYIPGVRPRFWRMAELLKAEDQILEEITEKVWSEVLLMYGEDTLALQLAIMRRQPLGIQRRLVRKGITALRSDSRDIDYAIVERVLDFVADPSQSKQVDIGLGLRAVLSENELVLATWDAKLVKREWLQYKGRTLISVPGEIWLEHDWVLVVQVLDDLESAIVEAHQNTNPYQAWLGLDRDLEYLSIRNRRPGDIIMPLGMGGKSMKMSDLMINLKMPRNARAYWPLVCVGDQVAWVPGYRIADPFRLGRGGDDKVVYLRIFLSKKQLG